jgi:hypothetical protein
MAKPQGHCGLPSRSAAGLIRNMQRSPEQVDSADGALSGDFRDWDRIRAWASDIAHQLDQTTAGRQQ